MKCLNPLRLKNPQYPEQSDLEFIDCACGKCNPCLVNRRRSWFFRLLYESTQWNKVYFLTLNPAPENHDGLVHRDVLQKFFKRLRKKHIIKHYSIGEYGPKTLHPHYHSIIFCNEPIEFIPYSDGFVTFEECTPAAINYVLHYHVRPKEPAKGLKTFFTCSKGLGLSFLFNSDGSIKNKQVAEQILNSCYRSVAGLDGSTFILPRYYTKKLEELGLSICKRPANNKIPYQELVKKFLPDAQFYSDGSCKNYSSSFVLKTLVEAQNASNFRLERYNKQSVKSI